MAPSKRANQYFEPGVQGRKTGITLPVNAKDEHGIENLDGIFSSPEKSPAKTNRVLRNGNTTLTSSDMDLAQSSVPEPTEVLSTRRLLKSTKTVFPPPMGRSPFKTNIGSSPRRQSSVAPMSQSRQHSSPERAASHPVVSRKLDFLAEDASTNGVQSPLRQAARRSGGRATRKDIYQLPVSPKRPLKRTYDQSILEEEEGEAVQEETIETEETIEQINGVYEDNDLPMNVDDSLQLLEDDLVLAIEDDEPAQLPSSPSNWRKRHANRATTAEADTQLETEELEEPVIASKPRRGGRARTSLTNGENVASQAKAANQQPLTKKGKGRKAKGNLLVAAPVQPVEESFVTEETSAVEESSALEDSVQEAQAEPAPVRKRGRPAGKPAKKAEQSVLVMDAEDDTMVTPLDESAVAPPQKKRRGRPPKVAVLQEAASRPTKKAKTSAKAPVERNSNIKMGPPAFKKPARPVPGSPGKRSVRAQSVASTTFGGSRSVLRLREGTPLEDEASHRTRSGRIAMPPVNFWLGEKVEYGRDGAKVGMLYADEIVLPKIERARPIGRPRRGKRARHIDDMDVIMEEEEEQEEWEKRGEAIRVFVNSWDEVLGQTGSEEEEQDIAFGANSLDIQQVGGGANFGFTKIHSSTFFGTGMIEIPPAGYKLKKNSRKMTMAFFVHTGKVDVTVADSEFTISKGGIWQVPRGNTYSIHNPGDKTSRVFFAQGCQVPVEEVE